MRKHPLAILLAAAGAGLAGPALAAEAITCDPPVLNVASLPDKATSYSVACTAPAVGQVTPKVVFTGEFKASGLEPYAVKASYVVDARDERSRRVGSPARADQTGTGTLKSATQSVAALPVQFHSQLRWDAESRSLSVEESAGVWRVFNLRERADPERQGLGALAEGEAYVPSSKPAFNPDADYTLSDAGLASTPLEGGRATAKVVLGKKFSRFAGSKAEVPVVPVILGLRDGKLEMLLGHSRQASNAELLNALQLLDRQPKDMARAWNLASRAQLLGLEQEVRYAEQKVAAHNPQLLTEFQASIQRIKPYELPR